MKWRVHTGDSLYLEDYEILEIPVMELTDHTLPLRARVAAISTVQAVIYWVVLDPTHKIWRPGLAPPGV